LNKLKIIYLFLLNNPSLHFKNLNKQPVQLIDQNCYTWGQIGKQLKTIDTHWEWKFSNWYNMHWYMSYSIWNLVKVFGFHL
jgi:hypothetical protein